MKLRTLHWDTVFLVLWLITAHFSKFSRSSGHSILAEHVHGTVSILHTAANE